MTKQFELWDDAHQNHLWFLLTDDNHVKLQSDFQHQIEGELQGNQFDLAPESPDHVWGFVDENKIELWDDQLHHFSGETA
jgi:hypothetical protein